MDKSPKFNLPQELVDKLIEHYSQLKNHFKLGRHENTELNASKFCEIVFRIIEFSLTRQYVPLGKQINQFNDQCRKFENYPSSGIDESLRIHIPRTLILIMDVRNKRGVGHVSGIHNPNLLDATLVTKCADWIFAELLRIHGGLSIDNAQEAVDKIIRIEIPIVLQIGEKIRVLKTELDYSQQVLAILYHKYPQTVSDKELFKWTEYSNFSSFCKKILKPAHSSRWIEYSDNKCLILPPGINEAEKFLKVN